MVSLQDFAKVGDTAVFISEPSIDFIEQQMLERGYLDSREMANMFNLLRANDLIWANVVNNYLMGDKPPAFDLLYWNSDGTRMAGAAHGWYLRNTYLENNLIKPGKIVLKGEAIDLGRIKLDAYAVGAEKDHIVPWDAAWRITQLLGGAVRFVLASSGHIAGIVNPPGGKGAYWTRRPGTVSPTRMAPVGVPPRRYLVDGLGCLARHRIGAQEEAPLDEEVTPSATAGRTRQLRPREIVNVKSFLSPQIQGGRIRRVATANADACRTMLGLRSPGAPTCACCFGLHGVGRSGGVPFPILSYCALPRYCAFPHT